MQMQRDAVRSPLTACLGDDERWATAQGDLCYYRPFVSSCCYGARTRWTAALRIHWQFA